ncbi:unnamed protein product [Calicophoron daubneyi]|uniref:DUF5738 domain-containing protein n=1 Tax=Calicophoron daubneyi TaxID=300641 RepID=A0AAV2TUN7_CALDB
MNSVGQRRSASNTQISSHITERSKARGVLVPRAPTPTILGSTNQCGSALATEIDTYRRRIQTLLHFFDCISQHWWDHLYPYKRDFIRRPSRSADEVRSYRNRLLARLSKFTMRSVMPAAAAIAMMEAHATVKVIPPNLLAPLSSEFTSTDISPAIDNGPVLLQKACNLARRIGDIEKLKQRLLLAALTWITSDGRDFNLRSQRIALLARHSEPCLIENFAGVRALLTHYYRPRVMVNESAGTHSPSKPTTTRVEPITAAKLTSTNEQITEAIEKAYPKAQNSVNGDDEEATQRSDDNAMEDTTPTLTKADELLGTLSADDPFTNNTVNSLFGSQVPVLPSIVLNPLAVDTSQLEWLSYEVNQREFNLGVLNSEEPEDSEKPLPRTALSNMTSVDFSSILQKTGSFESYFGDGIVKSTHQTKEANKSERLTSVWNATTPITTPNSRRAIWSDGSRESFYSGQSESHVSTIRQHVREVEEQQQPADDGTLRRLSGEFTESITSLSILSPQGEILHSSQFDTQSWHSGTTGNTFPPLEQLCNITASPGSKGEELPKKSVTVARNDKLPVRRRARTLAHNPSAERRRTMSKSRKRRPGSIKRTKATVNSLIRTGGEGNPLK